MNINKKGHLEVGEVDLAELAAQLSYPIYILDEVILRSNMQQYVQGLQEMYGAPSEVFYASKALMTMAMCKIAESEGLSIDVSSGGELYTAIRAGFPMEKIIMHGNNKLVEELDLAVQNGVGRIVIDNLEEISMLNEICEQYATRAAVLIRVKPGIEANTHRFMITGTDESKFGFSLTEALIGIKAIQQSSQLDFKGIHFHVGSQILSTSVYEKSIEVIADFIHENLIPRSVEKVTFGLRQSPGIEIVEEGGSIAEIQPPSSTTQSRELSRQPKSNFFNRTGYTIEELNIGGGLGIESSLTIRAFLSVVCKKITDEFKARNIPLPRLMVEPGRSIVGNAGLTLYKIGSIKKLPSGLTCAAVNGGMSDNIRPALYAAKYNAVLANRMHEPATCATKIVGKCCESGDILISEIFLPPPKRGDILALLSTGAYCYSMASHYNRLPIPGVALVSEGAVDWMVRPQTYEDLILCDCVPERLKKDGKALSRILS